MSTKRSRSRRKSKRGISGIIAVILLAVIIGFIAYFIFQSTRTQDDPPPGTTQIELYFFNTATGEFVIEPRSIIGGNQVALLNAALNEWKLGSSNPLHTHFLPETANVSIQHMPNGYVRVTFAQSLAYDLIPIERTLCHTSLVWSLTSLHFVESVQIYAGETYVITRNRANSHLEDGGIQQPYEEVVVVLYFGDDMGMMLSREEHTIERSLGTPIEEYVMNLLLAGPSNEAHRTIPANVTFLSIYTDNKISYVNFCAEFRASSSAAEQLMIFSIVNTLTELEHINQVQFLINNGRITDDMGFHHSLSTPVERDEMLMP